MSGKPVTITEFDLKRLKNLIERREFSNDPGDGDLSRLKSELERAQVVSPLEVSDTVVTMNSKVCLADLDTGEEVTYTLVYPEDADITKGKISILAPIGMAVLGYEVGDVFEWEVPAGKRRLRIVKIHYQPEAAGDYHL